MDTKKASQLKNAVNVAITMITLRLIDSFLEAGCLFMRLYRKCKMNRNGPESEIPSYQHE